MGEEKKKITKDEFFKYLKDKKKIDDKRIEDAWKEKEEEVKKSGYDKPEEVEFMTMRKVDLYFRKQTSSRDAVGVSIIVLGHGNITDYGAGKHYEKARKMFEQDPQRAVLEGYTNEQGVPLWKDSKIANRNGKPIFVDKEKRRSVYCLARRPEDTTWKVGMLGVSGKALASKLEMGKLYETVVIIGKATMEKWNGDRLIMYSTDTSEFKNPKEAPEKIRDMVDKYCNDIGIKFSDIETQARTENAGFFVVKANIVKSSESMPGISNRMILSNPDELFFDEDTQLTGWVDEDVPLSVVDEALDVYVFADARTYMKKDNDTGQEEEAIQLNVFGFFATDEYIKTEENTPALPSGSVTAETPAEEVVSDDSGEPSEKLKNW
ncbi:hypothetical protein ACFL96_14040 [Thermoproteota archaeon]